MKAGGIYDVSKAVGWFVRGERLIRFLDIVLSVIGLVVAAPLMLVVWLLGWWDTRSPLFRQERVGRHQRPFTLMKFRTMRLDTASVATHLAEASAVTPFGRFLRRTKLDELPQLWNVLKGEMSLVGPRPCLPNQDELIAERQRRGVFEVRPGITGPRAGERDRHVGSGAARGSRRADDPDAHAVGLFPVSAADGDGEGGR